ncbi:MAG: SHOCT domain-containing protein [Acidimicrobiia bacterium]|nr:SHOCT domain-containing protein [Acidimicrobiia bacterium]
MGSHGGWANGFGGGGPWFLFPILWILIIGTVIWLVARRNRKETPEQRATAILASRYARGEIDVDEYHKRLDGVKGL